MDSGSCESGNAYAMLGEGSCTNSNYMLFKVEGLDVLEPLDDHLWQGVSACLWGVWFFITAFSAAVPVQAHALSPHPLVWECPAPVLLHVCKALASQGFISHLRVMKGPCDWGCQAVDVPMEMQEWQICCCTCSACSQNVSAMPGAKPSDEAQFTCI